MFPLLSLGLLDPSLDLSCPELWKSLQTQFPSAHSSVTRSGSCGDQGSMEPNNADLGRHLRGAAAWLSSQLRLQQSGGVCESTFLTLTSHQDTGEGKEGGNKDPARESTLDLNSRYSRIYIFIIIYFYYICMGVFLYACLSITCSQYLQR